MCSNGRTTVRCIIFAPSFRASLITFLLSKMDLTWMILVEYLCLVKA